MKSSADELPDSAEERELLALAEELRAACPDPALDDAFAAGVRERLAQPWTLRRTLDSSRLARVAAALLVLVVGVAPVVALVRMLPWFRAEPPPIGFILPREAPDLGADDAAAPLPAPPAEGLTGPEALVHQDRMHRAARSWRAAGPAAPEPAAAPRIALWASATSAELWEEFVRRCALDAGEPLPDALAARVLELAAAATAAEDRRALAPWLWVLRGEYLPQSEARASHAWAGAPWLGGR